MRFTVGSKLERSAKLKRAIRINKNILTSAVRKRSTLIILLLLFTQPAKLKEIDDIDF